jgi:hypothetical protein
VLCVTQRNRIAQAVHNAVVRYTGGDGFQHCRLYAVTGWLLLSSLGCDRTVLQAGRITLVPDPDSPDGFEMDPSHGVLGEIHCWLALPDQTPPPGRHEVADNVQLIDFAARFYRRYCEDLPSVNGLSVQWTRPDPPLYIWGYRNQLPDWLGLSAQAKPTNGLLASLDKTEGPELLRLAKKYY